MVDPIFIRLDSSNSGMICKTGGHTKTTALAALHTVADGDAACQKSYVGIQDLAMLRRHKRFRVFSVSGRIFFGQAMPFVALGKRFLTQAI